MVSITLCDLLIDGNCAVLWKCLFIFFCLDACATAMFLVTMVLHRTIASRISVYVRRSFNNKISDSMIGQVNAT